MQWLGKHFPKATNITEKVLNMGFSMQSMLYQWNAGSWFLPELLVNVGIAPALIS
jgi:hypothetical protein